MRRSFLMILFFLAVEDKGGIMKRIRRPGKLALIVFLVFMLHPAAWGQSNDDAQKCAETKDNPDLRIHYCTRAIQSGQLSNENLAGGFNNRGNAYADKKDYDRAIQDYNEAIRLNQRNASALYNRGNAYANKQDYDRAIQDYNEAIRLNPNYANAFNSRGFAYANKQDYDRAIQDFNEAIRLDPKNASAFNNRGNAYRNKQDYDRAIQDFNDAIRLDPKNISAYLSKGYTLVIVGRFNEAQQSFSKYIELDPKSHYAVLYLYLARARGGAKDLKELQTNADKLNLSDWPGPIVKFYMGTVTSADLLAAAKSPDTKKEREQSCEANFYIGEQALIQGDPTAAVKFFKATLATGATSFVEYQSAEAELRRLAQKQ